MPQTDAAEPSYEAARAELRELADICQRWLDGASTRLDAAIAEHDVR